MPEASFEIVCPHCRKTFTAELIDGAAERYRGFKCPHCKLFVPAERTDADENAPAPSS
jgi:DNA-directed RNA polymerase subunit RPC12/RpoP